MSDSYVKFSEALYINSSAERAWLKRYLPLLSGQCKNVKSLLHSLGKEAKKCNAEGAFQKLKECIEVNHVQDWDIKRLRHLEYIWFYAKNDGSPEMVLSLVNIFLAKFSRDDYFVLSWSFMSDNVNIGHFGGGTGIACSRGFENRVSDWWVQDYLKSLDKRK